MSALNDLIAGYRRFRAGHWAEERARWAALAQGQSPAVMVIACSDSRVDPATVFDADPGSMFVVRNVAALVPPFEVGGGRQGVSAALEFAVTQLGVAEVVVLGHESCGGVSAALSRRFAGAEPGEGGFIAHWVDLLDPARERALADHAPDDPAVHEYMEQEAVRCSLANLRTFPFVTPREASGEIRLTGARFSIRSGVLHLLDEATGVFSPA